MAKIAKDLDPGNDNARVKLAKAKSLFGTKLMASFTAYNIWYVKSKAGIQPQLYLMVDRNAVARKSTPDRAGV